MKIKWICKYCGNINICEDTDRLVCDACDSLRSTETLTPLEGGRIAASESTGETGRRRKEEKPRYRIESGWTGREAYLLAIPLNEAAKRGTMAEMPGISAGKLPERPSLKEIPEPSEKPAEKKRPAPAGTHESEKSGYLPEGPWPEHRVVISPENLSELKAQGVTAVSRSEQFGIKGYVIVKTDGEHFLNVGKMKMMNFMTGR